jgi:hypothetical protein
MGWRVFAASAIGKQHIDAGLPCQDASAFERQGDCLIAAVCDGAGSAAHSDLGAATCAREVIQSLAAKVISLTEAEEAIKAAVIVARNTLESIATDREIPLRDLACTLVGAVLTPQGGMLFHVGDGFGIVELGEMPPVISHPENGEYANETWFVTGEDWASHLKITSFDGQAKTLALMSDGAMPFVVNRERTGLFGPFINPVGKYLAGVSEETGAAALAATLADEKTWSITGDDKTLLLAFPE